MNIYKDSRGVALPLILMVMLILAILGSTLWQYSSRDTIQAARNEKMMQAYYIARSGADAVAQYIIDNPDGINMKEYVDALVAAPKSNPTKINDEINGFFEVEVTRDEESKLIIIKSTGIVDGISQKVSLCLYESDIDGIPLLDMAVFSNKGIRLEGSSKIEGDAGINSSNPGSIRLAWSTAIDGNLFIVPDADPDEVLIGDRPDPKDNITKDIKNLDSHRIYNLPPFPEFPDDLPWCGSFTAGWNPSPPYHIYEDGDYDNITVKSELIIHIGDEDRILKVNNLEVSGSGKITLDKTGKGRLYLYISNSIILTNGATINNNGDPGDIYAYYKGSSPVNPSGSARFVGCIYAQKANVAIEGSGGITGHIITGGNSVSITGNAEANVRALYAPFATVTVERGAMFRGMLVCDSLTATGNSRIIFDNSSIEDTFSEIWGGNGANGVVYQKGIWQ